VTDDEFLAALESCILAERDFGHVAHVRAAYLYLRSQGFALALQKIQGVIRRYAASLGKPDRYHETITVAYLALIQQALHERGDHGGWEDFSRSNPQLLQRGLLLQFYPQAQLDSRLARQVFLLPRCADHERNSFARGNVY
jgi:hypothetical protein